MTRPKKKQSSTKINHQEAPKANLREIINKIFPKIRDITVSLATVIACIAAVLVVPDFREFFGLDPSPTQVIYPTEMNPHQSEMESPTTIPSAPTSTYITPIKPTETILSAPTSAQITPPKPTETIPPVQTLTQIIPTKPIKTIPPAPTNSTCIDVLDVRFLDAPIFSQEAITDIDPSGEFMVLHTEYKNLQSQPMTLYWYDCFKVAGQLNTSSKDFQYFLPNNIVAFDYAWEKNSYDNCSETLNPGLWVDCYMVFDINPSLKKFEFNAIQPTNRRWTAFQQ